MSVVQVRRWTRIEYDRMVDAGILSDTDRVELIDGEILTVTPQNSLHATGVRLVETALREVFGRGFDIRSQLPLALDVRSEPEPDVAVVRGDPRTYRDQHPTDAVLIVEVADSSLALDRSTKARIYARAGIADYWILNVADRALEVHRSPRREVDAIGAAYESIVQLREGDSIAPLALPRVTIPVANLLP